MKTWISNDSNGKYLCAEVMEESPGFEVGMIRSISVPNILVPYYGFQDGSRYFKCNISGLKTLKEWISQNGLTAADISDLFIQIQNVIHTVNNYLLSEKDLILETEHIYADEELREWKFCVIPGCNTDFEGELRKLIIEILSNVNVDDTEAMKLAFRLLKVSISEDTKIHDLMDVVKKTKPHKEEKPKKRIQQQEIERPVIPEEAVEAYVNETTEPEPAFIDETTSEESTYTLKRLITGTGISNLVLLAGVGGIYLLKGKAFVQRALPFYVIIAFVMTIYCIVDWSMKRKKRKIFKDN